MIDRREKARRMFFDGMSYTNIAKKLKLTPACVSQWSKKFGWAEEKENLKKKVDKKQVQGFLQNMTKRLVENSEQHIEISRLGCRMALEVMYKAFQEKPSNMLSIIERCIKIANMSSGIQKNVMPEAQEDVMRKYIEDLEKVKQDDNPKQGEENKNETDGSVASLDNFRKGAK